MYRHTMCLAFLLNNFGVWGAQMMTTFLCWKSLQSFLTTSETPLLGLVKDAMLAYLVVSADFLSWKCKYLSAENHSHKTKYIKIQNKQNIQYHPKPMCFV